MIYKWNPIVKELVKSLIHKNDKYQIKKTKNFLPKHVIEWTRKKKNTR